MFTADASILESLTFDIVAKYIDRHKELITRYNKLQNYYNGTHDILNRTKDDDVPNNKVVCNHAKEISDIATGYFIGNPITYNGDGIDKLIEWFSVSNIDKVDMELAKSMSINGVGFELVCMSSAENPTPKSYSIAPSNAFIVYDDTVEHTSLFAVYYYPVYSIDNKHTGYKIVVYTAQDSVLYETDANFKNSMEISRTINPFDRVQIIEYSNNDEQQGDFEQVISLIDAYNLLMSDRVNDKEQFVDAILLLINVMLGDTPDEAKEYKEQLMQNKLLELPENSDARYLVRTFDENGVSILQKALEQDIHKFANVPCLSDENFVGNASGVAMEYKLLGLEMIAKIKERHFKSGIQKRIDLYSAINGIKGGANIGDIEPVFTRGLPKNTTEIAGIVSQLTGIVPDEILLSLLPFVKDPKTALEMLAEQKQESVESQQALFGTQNNTQSTEDDE